MQVYTALAHFVDPQREIPPYTDYTIRSADGALYRQVVNGTLEPSLVELPAGSYEVVAQAWKVGLVTVPVVIRPGRATVVRLDGVPDPQLKSAGEADLVRLPNGHVVGWRAEAD